jgi:hypothetical protein
MTSENTWDPSTLDSDLLATEQWYDCAGDSQPDPHTNRFNEFGDYRHRVTVQLAAFFDRHDSDDLEDIIDQCLYHAQSSTSPIVTDIFYDAHQHETESEDFFEPDHCTLQIDPRTVAYRPPDYSLLRPLFGWLSSDVIRQTFTHTTQYARLPSGTLLKRSFKSSNPAINAIRRNVL